MSEECREGDPAADALRELLADVLRPRCGCRRGWVRRNGAWAPCLGCWEEPGPVPEGAE